MTRKLTLKIIAATMLITHRLKPAKQTIGLYGWIADRPIPDKAALRHYRYAKYKRLSKK